MRFNFVDDDARKLATRVAIPQRLALTKELLSDRLLGAGGAGGARPALPVYSLVATVTHHGHGIADGHYTADVMQSDGQWLRCDDASTVRVRSADVLHDQTYLLFYARQ